MEAVLPTQSGGSAKIDGSLEQSVAEEVGG